MVHQSFKLIFIHHQYKTEDKNTHQNNNMNQACSAHNVTITKTTNTTLLPEIVFEIWIFQLDQHDQIIQEENLNWSETENQLKCLIIYVTSRKIQIDLNMFLSLWVQINCLEEKKKSMHYSCSLLSFCNANCNENV